MPHYYTKEQADFIYEHVKGRGNTELTNLFNTHFGLKLKVSQIKAFKHNRGLSSGLDGQFKPGHTPFNKGRKGITQGGIATQFKKGDRPHNYKPIGYERIDRDGYVLVKIQDDGPWQKRWRHKHKVLWEKEYGPIPPGHKLLFADQNKQNITLENLILVSDKQMATLNKKGLIYPDADLTKTGIVMADIYQKISERKKAKCE